MPPSISFLMSAAAMPWACTTTAEVLAVALLLAVAMLQAVTILYGCKHLQVWPRKLPRCCVLQVLWDRCCYLQN